MRSLLRDAREHRVAAALLLVWWIALMAGGMYTQVYIWANQPLPPDPFFGPIAADMYILGYFLGEPGPPAPVASDLMILFPAFPVVAAILAGWWRATALKSGSWLGPSILSGLLAVLISWVAWALFIWGFNALIGPLIATGDWRPSVVLLVFGVVVYSVLGSVVGVLGGLVGGLAARASGRAPSDGKSVERMSSR